MIVAEYFVQRLLLEGVTHVFTVPGGTVLPLMEAMSRARSLQIVVCKDEQGAAFMADGYAWSSGKPGVVVTIGGPGATNALTGLCCAKAQGNPVVLVSGEINSTQLGRRAAQDGSAFDTDVTALSSPTTVLSVATATGAQARTALDEAFRRALRLRQPTHVSLPLDVQRSEVGGPPRRAASDAVASLARASRQGVDTAAKLLGEGPQKIAILLGRGAARAGAEVLELAEKLGAPVATTCGGKGIFPELHALSAGVFSFGSGPLGRATLTGGVDVLLAIGTGLGEFATMNYARDLMPRKALIHVDQDPAVFDRNYECLPVCGDATEACRALLRALPPALRGDSAWFAQLRREQPRVFEPERLLSAQLPIRPERLMSALQHALPPTAHLVADIGTSCLFVAHCLQLTPPQRCYLPMVWSCMGHPLGAALGVRVGSGQPTICVAGDAAFLAKGLELHTAVELGVSELVIVVLANRGHGLVRLGTRALTDKSSRVEDGTFQVTPEIVTIGRALGAEALKVNAPAELEAALKHGLNCGRPCLIEVAVDPDAAPPMADRLNSLDQVGAAEVAHLE